MIDWILVGLFQLHWRFLPKRVAEIDGRRIQFALSYLPIAFSTSELRRRHGGGTLIDRSTRKVKIFLSPHELAKRRAACTLLHEYYEGKFVLERRSYIDLMQEKFWTPFLLEIVSAVQRISSREKPSYVERRVTCFLWNFPDKGHLFALMMEAEYAKRTLPTSQYEDVIMDMITNRL